LSWKASNAKLSFGVTNLEVIGTTLFALAGYNEIFRSTNNGNSWIQAKNNGLTYDINSFAIILSSGTASGSDIFAGTGYARGSIGGVYVSTDDGDNWSPCNDGLTNHEIGHLYSDGSNLFAATNGGLFISSNRGHSWSNISFGTILNTSAITAMTTYGQYLIIGTNGIGVWLYPLFQL
jgi:hypothetical protein